VMSTLTQQNQKDLSMVAFYENGWDQLCVSPPDGSGGALEQGWLHFKVS